MLTVYVDPSDANQVMAYYKGCKPGNPANWTDQGFIEVTISDEDLRHADVMFHKRNCRLQDDVVTPRVNPTQPIPAPRTQLDDLRDKLADDSINPAEMRQMMRLERGL